MGNSIGLNTPSTNAFTSGIRNTTSDEQRLDEGTNELEHTDQDAQSYRDQQVSSIFQHPPTVLTDSTFNESHDGKPSAYSSVDSLTALIKCTFTAEDLMELKQYGPDSYKWKQLIRVIDLCNSAVGPELPEELFTLEGAELLNVSNTGLRSLSSRISQLRHLSKLQAKGNQISTIPAAINDLHLLECLELSDNPLLHFDVDVCMLQNLTGLGLNACNLSHFPAQIFQLSNLETLGLFNNSITKIPAEISMLTSLRKLDLSYNQIVHVPKEIESLVNLVFLNLTSNRIQTIPDEISALYSLSDLGLAHNKLESVPLLKPILNLTRLDLSNNHLERIPLYLFHMPSLVYLNLKGNYINDLGQIVNPKAPLQSLDVSFNNLQFIPSGIKQFPRLFSFNAAGNSCWLTQSVSTAEVEDQERTDDTSSRRVKKSIPALTDICFNMILSKGIQPLKEKLPRRLLYTLIQEDHRICEKCSSKYKFSGIQLTQNIALPIISTSSSLSSSSSLLQTNDNNNSDNNTTKISISYEYCSDECMNYASCVEYIQLLLHGKQNLHSVATVLKQRAPIRTSTIGKILNWFR